MNKLKKLLNSTTAGLTIFVLLVIYVVAIAVLPQTPFVLKLEAYSSYVVTVLLFTGSAILVISKLPDLFKKE